MVLTSGNIILDGTDGSSSNAFDNLIAEDRTSDVAMYSQVGSSSGTGSILNWSYNYIISENKA